MLPIPLFKRVSCIIFIPVQEQCTSCSYHKYNHNFHSEDLALSQGHPRCTTDLQHFWYHWHLSVYFPDQCRVFGVQAAYWFVLWSFKIFPKHKLISMIIFASGSAAWNHLLIIFLLHEKGFSNFIFTRNFYSFALFIWSIPSFT